VKIASQKLSHGALVPYYIGLLNSLLVAVAVSAISQLPLRYMFSILFGTLTFFIYYIVIKNRAGQFKFKGFTVSPKFVFHPSKDLYALVLYAISLALVLLIPSAAETQFVAWAHIPTLNYIRLFAGLLLSSILPGYGLLRLIDRKNRFDGLNLVVFSFFTSVFATTFLSYTLLVLNMSIENTFLATLIFNLIVLSLYSFAFITNIRKENVIIKEEKSHHNFDYLILACIFCFFIIGWVIYYSSYPLGSTGDMWSHYSTYLQLAKGVNIFSFPHLAYLGAETWIPLHYVTVSLLTGFPALNGWMVYAFINFFYILAVYQAVRGIVGVNHPKIPVIATVIATLFGGFGWVKALSLSSGNNWLIALNTAGRMTYNDIVYSFLYGPIPEYFSLAVLFSLLYLMVRKDKFDVPSAFLTVVLVALGLLVHSPEIIMLPIFYYCYLLFVHREEFARLRKYSLSLLVGLLVVFIVGLPFSSHFYFSMELPLLFLFLTVSLTFVLMHFRAKFSHSFAFPKRLGIVLVGSVWVLYILSFFAWNSTLNLGVTANLVVIGLLPWYIYPVYSGISLLLGLLGLTCLVAWRKFKLENAKFLVLAIVALFLTGIILSYVNINIFATGYWEKRFYTFMILPVSVLGAFFIVEVVPKMTLGRFAKGFRVPAVKYVMVGLLISLIVVSGVSSNILSLDRTALVSQGDPYAAVSKAELQALDFLRVNASADATVLGLSTVSNRLVTVFSGMNHLNSPYLFTGKPPFQFVDITNPELALKMLYSLNITYLFATKSDLETLQSSGYIVNHLLKYLPIAFQNSEVTIYQVPKLDPPSSDSNLTLVVPSYMIDSLSDPKVLLQNLPKQVIFNETFSSYNDGSDGAPTWTPTNLPGDKYVGNGTWTVNNGTYNGLENQWAMAASLISNEDLSDFSLSVDFKIDSGYYAGIVFRAVNSSNFYATYISVDGRYDDIYKVVNGTMILIKHSTGPSIGNNWTSLQLDAYGNQFSLYLNGKLIVSISNSLFTSGQVGVFADNSMSSFDNITIEQPPNVAKNIDYTFNFPIDVLAQSGLEYSIKIADDGSIFDSKYLLLPSDQDWSNEQIHSYLNWVENGGRLIVLNGDGLGDFAKILSINSNSDEPLIANSAVGQSSTVELGTLPVSSLFSSDEQVKGIANYTNENDQSVPLAFSKQVGNGEIIYVNVSPLFENLYSANGTATNNFQKIGILLNLLNLNTSSFKDTPSDKRWQYMLYDTTWIRDYTQLQGAVNIESNSTILPYDQFNVHTLELVNATGTINGLPIQEPMFLQNVAINNLLEKGAAHSVIKSQGIYLIPTDYGRYSCLFSESAFNISMQVPEGGVVFSVITKENETYDINLQSGTLFMQNITTTSPSNISVNTALPNEITGGNKTLLLARTPSISVNGTSSFSEAVIPNYINYVNGYSVQIKGTTHFSFDCSSDNVMMLTDFGYTGTFQTGQETTKISMIYWELIAIPWASILTSPLFLIFCILLAMVVITIYSTYSKASGKKTIDFHYQGLNPEADKF
jgi:hypothetical protein